MDFNTEIFIGNKLNSFRHAMSLPDLTIGELYAMLKWFKIEPIRFEGKSKVFSRYKIESLLKSHNALMNMREKLLNVRKKKHNETNKITKNIEPKSPYVGKVNYYSNKDMEKMSDELLRKQEVWFDDENDDNLFESMFSRNFYITESQYKNIKKRLMLENSNNCEKFDVVDENSDVYKKIKKCLNFKNNSNLALNKVSKVTNKHDNEIHYVAEIYGGLNGNGEWTNYLDDIQYLLLKMKDAWIVDLSCDCADDVWTLEVGLKIPSTLNEGCWGYEWYDSDQTLDECSVFAKKMLSWVCDSIRKKLKQKYGTPTDYIYGYLGIIRELLKTEEIFRERLSDNDTWFELQSLIEKGYKYCIEKKDTYREPDKFEKKITKLKKDLDDLLNKKYVRENKKIVNENQNVYFIDTNKVNVIKKFLDSNFVRASINVISNDGLPVNKPVIGLKDNSGKVVKNLTPQQLFYLIQDKFKNIYNNKDKRNKLLKQIVIDWYNNKISKEGLLSINQY
jgi:hypothetical protein